MSKVAQRGGTNGQRSTRRVALLLTLSLAGSVAGALLAVEVVLRIAYRESLDLDMEMWKYATTIKAASPDPTLGHRHAPNRRARLMGVEVATNRFGLRDAPDLSVVRAPGTYRIAVFGDSFTLGWGVEASRVWVRVLEDLLQAASPQALPAGTRVETLNFGVGNFNTTQEVALLRSLGAAFSPDLVLVAAYVNDAEPLHPIRRRWLLEHSYLAAFLVSRVRRLPFAGDRLDYVVSYRALYRDGQPGWAAMRSAMRSLGAWSRQVRTPVAVVVLPDLRDLSDNYPFEAVHDSVTRLVRDAGLTPVDLLPALRGTAPAGRLWVTPQDAHPNEEAHRLIALAVRSALDSLPLRLHPDLGRSAR